MHTHRWTDLYVLVGLSLLLPGKQHDIRHQNEGLVDPRLLVTGGVIRSGLLHEE